MEIYSVDMVYETTSIYFDNNTLNVQGVNLPLDLMIQLFVLRTSFCWNSIMV